MKIIALAAATVVLAPGLSAQTVLWNEYAQGDLPASLGPINPGSNLVFGAVGYGAGGNFTRYDEDRVLFNIPSGLTLQQLLVETLTGDVLFFDLQRVTSAATNDVAFRMFPSGAGPADLLLLARPYGPQPAATYLLSVGPALSELSLRNYALDFVVATVPEPATASLLAAALPLILFKRRRRAWAMPPNCPAAAGTPIALLLRQQRRATEQQR